MDINEGKDKLALFSTKYSVLLTPLPFRFYLSPQSLLHNFIIFPPQCFYSLLHNFYYFPSSYSSSSSFLLFSLLVLLLIFSVFPPPPRPHFYCFYLLNRPAERGKLKFQKSTTCIFWPQKFSFKLPIVLKTDFKRRDNALEIDFGL